MATTALTIVNNVLARMREDQVTSTTFATNTYAQLMLRFVNDAKNDCENAWDWSVLRTEITVEILTSTTEYTVVGAGSRFRFYDRMKRIFVPSSNLWIYPYPTASLMALSYQTPATSGAPQWYAFKGVAASGDPKIVVYPTPDNNYSARVPLVVPEPNLVAHGDSFSISSLPVELGAWARAISERGEDGGQNTSEQWQMYLASLGDHISMDAGRNEDELIWAS